MARDTALALWRDPALGWILALALATRAGIAALYPTITGFGDEPAHYVSGVLAAHFGERAIGHWAPGYEAFLGAVFAAAGPHPIAARAAQVLISTLTVALVYGIARRVSGRKAARIAGTLSALDPSLIAYSHYLYSETLLAALLAGAAYALCRRPEAPTRREGIAAGVLLGFATLTRSYVLYFLPIWVGWLALRRRWEEARSALGALLVALAIVAPWTLRNAMVYGDFLLVDGTAGLTAHFAFNEVLFNSDLGYPRPGPLVRRHRARCPPVPEPRRELLPPVAELKELFSPGLLDARTARRLPAELARARRFAGQDTPAVQRCELARALAFARQRPELVLEHIAARPYAFWGPNSFLLRSVHGRAYPGGVLGRDSYPVVKAVVVGSYLLVVTAAILALGRPGRSRFAEWTLLLCAYATAVHSLAVAYSRYRLPLMPLLMVLASVWLARPQAPARGRRAVLAYTALAAFLVLSIHYVSLRLP